MQNVEDDLEFPEDMTLPIHAASAMREREQKTDERSSPLAHYFMSPGAPTLALERLLNLRLADGKTVRQHRFPTPRGTATDILDKELAILTNNKDVQNLQASLHFIKSFAESYFRSNPKHPLDRILGRRYAGVKEFQLDEKTGQWNKLRKIPRPTGTSVLDQKIRRDQGFEPYHGVCFSCYDLQPLALVADNLQRESELDIKDYYSNPFTDPLTAELNDILVNGFRVDRPPSAKQFEWRPVFGELSTLWTQSALDVTLDRLPWLTSDYIDNTPHGEIGRRALEIAMSAIASGARGLRAMRQNITDTPEGDQRASLQHEYDELVAQKKASRSSFAEGFAFLEDAAQVLTFARAAETTVFLEGHFLGRQPNEDFDPPGAMEWKENQKKIRKILAQDFIPRYTGTWDFPRFPDKTSATVQIALADGTVQDMALHPVYEALLQANQRLRGTLEGAVSSTTWTLFNDSEQRVWGIGHVLLTYLWTSFGDAARDMIYVLGTCDDSDLIDARETRELYKMWAHHPLLKKEQLLAADLDQMARDKFGKTQDGSKQARAGSGSSKPLPKFPTALAQNVGPFLGRTKLFRDPK
jgi:hypothetical protein